MKKALLLILDGWGINARSAHNAIAQANPPFWNKLNTTYPTSILTAREETVGISQGCLSGSEVGHTIIGAGRIIWQHVAKIDADIKSGVFLNNPSLRAIHTHVKKNNSTLHLLGLLSDGGIHAHITHLEALLEWAKTEQIESVALHLFLDGRDMAPKSAKKLLEPLLKKLNGKIHISTICGRDLMDRNENWEKTTRAFNYLVNTQDIEHKSILEYIDACYQDKLSDEFIAPAKFVHSYVSDNDALLFFNFRADRMRQILKLFCGLAPQTLQTHIEIPKHVHLATMSEYGSDFDMVDVLYPKEIPHNSLGEWISAQGLSQFRIAESEKYAHVTYFFNGGREVVFEKETRLIIPSLGLSNYARAPHMSLPELQKVLLRTLDDEVYDFIVGNIANGDMVGHSGDMDAAIQAVTHVDDALSHIIHTATDHGYTTIITSDHGNIEYMRHDDEPHTAHTFNDVPLIITDPKIRLKPNGFLHQVAPTILEIMEIEKPKEMTSESIIKRSEKLTTTLRHDTISI